MWFLTEVRKQWIAVAFLSVLLLLGWGWMAYEAGPTLFCAKDESSAACLRGWIQTVGSFFALVIAAVAARFTFGQMVAADSQARLAHVQRIEAGRSELRKLRDAIELNRKFVGEYEMAANNINQALEKIPLGEEPFKNATVIALNFDLIYKSHAACREYSQREALTISEVSLEHDPIARNVLRLNQMQLNLSMLVLEQAFQGHEIARMEVTPDRYRKIVELGHNTLRKGRFGQQVMAEVKRMADIVDETAASIYEAQEKLKAELNEALGKTPKQ